MSAEVAKLPGFLREFGETEDDHRVMVYEFDNLESAKTLHQAFMSERGVFGRIRAAVTKRADLVGSTYELSFTLSKVAIALLCIVLTMGGAFAADLRFIIPSEPAATYDQIGRLFARHMGYTAQNHPGASGVIAANVLYSAPADGSVLGIVHTAAIQAQALGELGVRFDAAKFGWIGTPTQDGGTVVVWHTSPVRTLADLRTTEVTVGVSNIRQLAWVRLANQVLGTRFKIIRGYPSGAHIALALARGEIDCSVVYPWAQWRAFHPSWVAERRVVPIVDLAHLTEYSPAFIPLAAIDSIGRPLALPPRVAPVTVRMAKVRFRELLKSPAFLAEAKKIGLEVAPVEGRDLARLVSDVLDMPADTKAMLKKAID